jgi:hypothetical protein
LPWAASKFCILYNSRSPTRSWTALMIARGLQCVGGGAPAPGAARYRRLASGLRSTRYWTRRRSCRRRNVTRSDSVLSQGAASHLRSRSDEVLGAQIRKRASSPATHLWIESAAAQGDCRDCKSNSLGPGSNSFVSTSARLCDGYVSVARDALIACGLFGCNVDGLDV